MGVHLIDRIAVEDEGDGDAVVCVHGLGGSSNTWTPLMGALARYRVIRIDLPGSGRSQRVEGNLSMEGWAEAVRSVCARLNIDRAHFLGHSLGTIVCQHVAAAAPKLVRSLALFGPLAAPGDAVRPNLRARAAKARDEGLPGMQQITEALLNASVSSDTRQRLPVAVAFVRESLLRQEPANYGRSCAVLAEAQPAALEKIVAPVLLVTGEDDVVAPPQAVRALADRLHNAPSKRVVVFPRCGHWEPVERPDECMRELREFLSAQR